MITICRFREESTHRFHNVKIEIPKHDYAGKSLNPNY